jgi:hypothetical protein
MASLPTVAEMRAQYEALQYQLVDAVIQGHIDDAKTRICVILGKRYDVSLWPSTSFPPVVASWVREGAFALFTTKPEIAGGGEAGDQSGADLWKRVLEEVREAAKDATLLDDDLAPVPIILPDEPPNVNQFRTIKLRTLAPVFDMGSPARQFVQPPIRTPSTNRSEMI